MVKRIRKVSKYLLRKEVLQIEPLSHLCHQYWSKIMVENRTLPKFNHKADILFRSGLYCIQNLL